MGSSLNNLNKRDLEQQFIISNQQLSQLPLMSEFYEIMTCAESFSESIGCKQTLSALRTRATYTMV